MADHIDIDDDERVPDDGRDDWPEPPSFRGLKWALAGLGLAAVGAGIFLSWDYLIPVDHRSRAMEFLAQENYASTVTELKHVLRDNPGDGELRWMMGDAYLQLKQNDGAADYMQEAFDLGYRSPDLVLALARSKLLVRDYKGVQKLYIDWSDVDSDISASAWEVLHGQALLNLGSQQKAVAAFLQALRLNPHNGEAKRGLVESGLGANLAGLSPAEVERALSTGLDQPETWILRGELELSRGNLKDARIAFEGAVELDPENVHALTGLVRILIASNKLEEAREPAALLAQKFPMDPMSAYVRALYAKQVEQYVQALDALKVVLDYEPDHAMSLLLMGEIYSAMGNREQALEYLHLFHRMVPDSVLGRRQLAAAMNQNGLPKQAIALLDPLLEEVRRDPEIAAVLASAYTALDDKQRAKGYQSLSFKLGSVTSATRVALELLNSGDTDEAISKLEQLVDYAPDKVDTSIMLTIALLRSGEYDKALNISTTLLATHPDDPQIQYLHGSVLELAGDRATAAQFYEEALTLSPKFNLADLALARIEIANGNHEIARQRIEALLVKDRSNTTAQLWLTQMALNDGSIKDALARLEKIRAANKTALQPRLLLADLYLQQGNANDALRVSREIVKMVPNHQVGIYLLANAQLLAGNTDEGLAMLQQLENANPENLDLKWQIVAAQEVQGNTAEAYDTLQRILSVDDSSARALVKLAMMERLHGNPEVAAYLAEKLIDTHPASGMGYLIQGQILMDSGDYLQASDALAIAHVKNNDSITLSRYYTALARAGKDGEAEKTMSDWLAANSSDNLARIAWADEAARAGNTAQAVEQYEQVVSNEPGNVAALVRLASGYHELADRRDLKTAQQAYELDPEDLYAKHLYGWLLVETGLGDRGAQLLQDVVARAPDNAIFRVHLAVALADSGLEDDAKIALQPLRDAGIQLAEIPQASALLGRLGIEPPID